jgi:hypothetical protein
VGLKPKLYFVCQKFWKRGKAQCSNKHGVPYDRITEAVLSHFKPEAVRAAVQAALMDQLHREPVDSPVDQRAELDAERRRIEQQNGNLVTAIRHGGDIPELLASLKAGRERLAQITADLEALADSTLDLDLTDEEAVEEWKAMQLEAATDALAPLDAADTATARQVLRELLREPITVRPVVDAGRVVAWEYGPAIGTLDRLIAGRLENLQLRGVPRRRR